MDPTRPLDPVTFVDKYLYWSNSSRPMLAMILILYATGLFLQACVFLHASPCTNIELTCSSSSSFEDFSPSEKAEMQQQFCWEQATSFPRHVVATKVDRSPMLLIELRQRTKDDIWYCRHVLPKNRLLESGWVAESAALPMGRNRTKTCFLLVGVTVAKKDLSLLTPTTGSVPRSRLYTRLRFVQTEAVVRMDRILTPSTTVEHCWAWGDDT